MRDNPGTLEEAVTVAMNEQNLQERFGLRANKTENGAFREDNQFGLGQMPMKVDHYRSNKGML